MKKSIQSTMFRKAFLTVAVTELAQESALLIDSIITTKFLGTEDIAAVGLAAPFFCMVGIVSDCLATGLQIRCSNEIGQGDVKKAQNLYCQTMEIGFLFMVAVFVLFNFTVPSIAGGLGAYGAAENLRASTSNYLYGLLLELTPFVLLSVVNAVACLSSGGNKIIIASAVACGVTDILFDIIAVYFNWGVLGIGLATSLSVIVSLIISLRLLKKYSENFQFHIVPLNLKEIKNIISSGLTVAIHNIAATISPILLNSMILSIGGSQAMAVMSCESTIADFVMIPSAGICSAVTILCSVAYGELNKKDLHIISASAFKFIIAISVSVMLIMICFSNPISIFYFGKDIEIIPLMQYMIIALAISLPFHYLINTRIGYLTSVNQLRSSQILEPISNMIVPLSFAYVLGKIYGIKGLFLSIPASYFFVCLIIFVAAGIRRKRIPIHVGDYLSVGKQFNLSPGDYIDYMIETVEGGELASEQMMLFCKGHKLESNLSNQIGNAVKEIAISSMQRGEKENQSVAIDFRAAYSEKLLIVRLRDDGNSFDITQDKNNETQKIRDSLPSTSNLEYYRIWDTNTIILKYQL